MEIKQFRNKYDLELIPASNENIILGNLVWDPIIGKPKFDHSGMPNNIFNSFRDANLIKDNEYKGFLKGLNKVKLIDANMADQVVDVDIDLVNSLEHPKIGKLSANFDLKSIKKFTFGTLQARTMSNLLRVRIDDYLEELKVSNWDHYDGKIRRVFMITELYYGSIKVVINKNVKNEFTGAIPKADLELENEAEFSNSIEYTFKHKNVPFAMKIEKVKTYNG